MRSRTPSPRTDSRTRRRSRSRSPPGRRSRSRTPETKRHTTFTIYESDQDTQDKEEEEYLEEAAQGDYLVFFGNAQGNTWKKICIIEHGIKKWVLLNNNAFGIKRKSTRKV